MSKFRSWHTSIGQNTSSLREQNARVQHELRGRSRLSDSHPQKALFARSPIGWGVQGQGLRIDNLGTFFGAEGPRSLDFKSVDEPLMTPLGSRVYLASNDILYAVVLEQEIVVLTPNRSIAGDIRMQLALDGLMRER